MSNAFAGVPPPLPTLAYKPIAPTVAAMNTIRTRRLMPLPPTGQKPRGRTSNPPSAPDPSSYPYGDQEPSKRHYRRHVPPLSTCSRRPRLAQQHVPEIAVAAGYVLIHVDVLDLGVLLEAVYP